jgi:hypothetical protein
LHTSRRRARCHAYVNSLRKSFGHFEGTQQPFGGRCLEQGRAIPLTSSIGQMAGVEY